MSTWFEYREAQWKNIDYPFPDSNETDGHKALIEWGYTGYDDEIGREWGLMFCIHSRQEEKDFNRDWEFLVDVTPTSDTTYAVLIRDLPNLLSFLREYLPLFERDALRLHLQGIEEVLTKTFMAWHGHPSYDACRDCDYVERRLSEKRRR